MKTTLTSVALGALLLSQTVLAGLYSSKDHVVNINTKNFQAEVMDSNHLVMLEFYAPWCGHCKNLVPHYKAAAKNLHGIVKMGAIDCDDDSNRPICSQYGITGFPTIKVFSVSRSAKKTPKVPTDYQGERSAKALVDHLLQRIPNDIKLVSSNPTSDRITNIDEFVADDSSARALLFSKKSTSSNMYKGLATEFKDKMTVAEMRNPSADVLARFNVEEPPVLVVFPKGSQEADVYKGELKRDPISEFLGEHAGIKTKGKTEAPPAPFNPEVSKIVDQAEFKKECLDKSAGTCAIAFLVVEGEFPESVQIHEENLAVLRTVKQNAHDNNKALSVVWMDALDKRVQDLIQQFQISSDTPGLLLIKPNKKAFVPFVGAFDVEGIQSWLSDSNSGRARAFPYTFDVALAERETAKVVKDEL